MKVLSVSLFGFLVLTYITVLAMIAQPPLTQNSTVVSQCSLVDADKLYNEKFLPNYKNVNLSQRDVAYAAAQEYLQKYSVDCPERADIVAYLTDKFIPKYLKDKNERKECVTFKFHYLEIENVLYSPAIRHIEIFLDDKAFSEENLKTLFAYLSERNPEPTRLTVSVHTDWAQLWLPSDCPPGGISEQPGKPDEYDYHKAIFYRRENNEFFDYYPVLKTSKYKLVQMKGDKIYINGKLQDAKEVLHDLQAGGFLLPNSK